MDDRDYLKVSLQFSVCRRCLSLWEDGHNCIDQPIRRRSRTKHGTTFRLERGNGRYPFIIYA